MGSAHHAPACRLWCACRQVAAHLIGYSSRQSECARLPGRAGVLHPHRLQCVCAVLPAQAIRCWGRSRRCGGGARRRPALHPALHSTGYGVHAMVSRSALWMMRSGALLMLGMVKLALMSLRAVRLCIVGWMLWIICCGRKVAISNWHRHWAWPIIRHQIVCWRCKSSNATVIN